MNILVIHEVSYEGKVVYEYQDFAERLSARGHRVHVIDFDESGRHFGPQRCVSRTGIGKVELHQTPCLNLPILRLISGKLLFPFFLRRFIREKKIDVIWLYSVFINGEATIRVAQSLRVPVVYRVLDVYHKVRQNRLIQLPLLWGERFIYRNSDRISLTNAKMQVYVESLIGEPLGSRGEIHQHGVDTEFFRPMARDIELASQAGIEPGTQVILFLGTLYSFSGLDHLVREIARRRHDHPRVKLVIVGNGEQEMLLKRLVAELGLDQQVYLAGRQPYSEVPRWLSLADVTVTPFELNDVTRDIVPIKVLQYLAAGKPMVSAPISDVMKLAPTADSGVVYEDIGRPDRFMDATLALLASPSELKQSGEKARAFVLEHFSMELAIRRVEQSLESARNQGAAIS